MDQYGILYEDMVISEEETTEEAEVEEAEVEEAEVEEAGELILQLSEGESERDEREEKERIEKERMREHEWFHRGQQPYQDFLRKLSFI